MLQFLLGEGETTTCMPCIKEGEEGGEECHL